MALFRDPVLPRVVSQDNLILLIREAGSALLDSRLSAPSDLDESTGLQMVRAINKVRDREFLKPDMIVCLTLIA